jgi:hypothetical protein
MRRAGLTPRTRGTARSEGVEARLAAPLRHSLLPEKETEFAMKPPGYCWSHLAVRRKFDADRPHRFAVESTCVKSPAFCALFHKRHDIIGEFDVLLAIAALVAC